MKLEDLSEVRQAAFNEFWLGEASTEIKSSFHQLVGVSAGPHILRQMMWIIWCEAWDQSSMWAVDAACDRMMTILKSKRGPK